MTSIAVVTDSTAYLPAAQAAAAHVTVVPVQVVVGGETRDETDVSSDAIADALREWRPISTSRPAPSAFVEAYQRLALGGATEIVSVHLSGAMSATVESAQLAAKEVDVPVRVVDSRSIGMGLGFPVLAAAQAAVSGADAARVEEIAKPRRSSARRCRSSRCCTWWTATLLRWRRCAPRHGRCPGWKRSPWSGSVKALPTSPCNTWPTPTRHTPLRPGFRSAPGVPSPSLSARSALLSART
jgi:hypothetical protein